MREPCPSPRTTKMPENSHVEIQFQLHPSPRRSDSAEPPPVQSVAGRLPRVTQMLALALRYQDMIRAGVRRITPTWRV